MAYALHSSDIFHQISGHGALNEGNASLCGSFCQSNIRLILEQAIESGWSNHQRHFSHASNDGPLEAAVRLINQSMRHEPPFSERLSFPIKRGFVLCSALQIFKHETRHQLVSPSAQIGDRAGRSEEHTSELQSLMRTSYAVFCL